MKKIDHSKMAKKLVEMPSCTFKAPTPEGLLTIAVDEKKREYTDNGQDVRVEVTIKRKDGSYFSKISYSNLYSSSVNGSGGYNNLIETISHKANNDYPLGYVQYYDHNNIAYGSSNKIVYEKDGKKYAVEDFSISTDEKFCAVRVYPSKNIIFVGKISDNISLGIDLTTNKQILYITRKSMKEKVSIPINDDVDIASMVASYNCLFTKAISEITRGLIEQHKGKNGERLCSLLPTIEEFSIPEDVNLGKSIEEIKNLLELYKRDTKLLYEYHDPETQIAIVNAVNEYTNQKEIEKAEAEVARLKRKIPNK